MKNFTKPLNCDPLKPAQRESIILPSGMAVDVSKCVVTFKKWEGALIKDNYGGKTVLDYYGKPLFAELVILRILQENEWRGVWVDTYRKKFRNSLPELSPQVNLPSRPKNILNKIIKENGGLRGCWDVFAWKGGRVMFAESKRRSKDAIRNTQKRWLETALRLGFPQKSFLLVEWDLKEK
jgi:hypothetical protein